MAADGESGGLPRRRTPDLPPEFAPLEPLRLPDQVRRTPGEPPRLRLTASASRRNAPDRPVFEPTSAAPLIPRARGPVLEPPRVQILAPPPAPPQAPGPRRTSRVVAGVAALVVLGGATVLLWPDGPTEPDRAAASPTAAQEQLDGDYAPPVPLSADSEYVETEVLGDGDLRVTHWISTSDPMEQLELQPPTGAGDRVVDVEDVSVAVDGVPVDPAVVGTGVPVALGAGQRLFVQYVLAGAVDRSGAAGSRGLANVTSLGLGLDGRSLPRTQVFPGARVMTLACVAQGASAVAEPCGSREEGTWTVASSAGQLPVTVIAQLDLTVTR